MKVTKVKRFKCWDVDEPDYIIEFKDTNAAAAACEYVSAQHSENGLYPDLYNNPVTVAVQEENSDAVLKFEVYPIKSFVAVLPGEYPDTDAYLAQNNLICSDQATVSVVKYLKILKEKGYSYRWLSKQLKCSYTSIHRWVHKGNKAFLKYACQLATMAATFPDNTPPKEDKRRRKGSRSPSSKWTWDEICEIRRLYENDELTACQLACEYDMSMNYMWCVLRYEVREKC